MDRKNVVFKSIVTLDGWMDGWMDGWVDIDRDRNGWMDGW